MLFEDSRHDRLTGLGNRRRLDEDLERLADQAKRYEHPMTVVLFDVDRFKQYNDSAGHAAGRRGAALGRRHARRSSAAAATPRTATAARSCSSRSRSRTSRAATIAAERMRGAIEALRDRAPGADASAAW